MKDSWIQEKLFDVLEMFLPKWSIIIGLFLITLSIVSIGIMYLFEHFHFICPPSLFKLTILIILMAIAYTLVISAIAVIKNIRMSKPGEIFKGEWKNTFSCPPEAPPSDPPEKFEVRNGNQYICWGEHRFNIINFRIDKKKKKLYFTKVYVTVPNNFNRYNDLTIEDTSKMDHFSGMETGDAKERLTKVDYQKIKYSS